MGHNWAWKRRSLIRRSRVSFFKENKPWCKFILLMFPILFILIPMPVLSGKICKDFPLQSFEKESMIKYKGTYNNYSYGYSVTIPKGLIGSSDPPPSPQHGFGILLSRQPKGYIWVNGESNSLFWQSTAQAADQHIEWIKERVNKILSVQKAQKRLGKNPAIRLIVQYECNDAIMVEDYFISIDFKRQIVYVVALSADDAMYNQYKKILEKIANTFQTIKRR